MGYIKYQRFPELEIFTSTRLDGNSKPPFDSFNLSYTVGDDKLSVYRNRQQLMKDFSIKEHHLIVPLEMHEDKIVEVTKADMGKGELDAESGIKCDAIYTKDKDLALGVYHSDCAPIVLYSPKAGIISAIHSGIKGTLKEITKKACSYLIDKQKVDPNDIYAYIGPGVNFSHYIIDDELKNKVKDLGYIRCIKVTDGVTFLDTSLINYMQLRSLGVPSTNIDISPLCTYENANIFFSESRARPTGRMLTVIKFKH